jgi:hypothetical protein
MRYAVKGGRLGTIVWKERRDLTWNRTLIVGCGAGADHQGTHEQCDTVDIDERINPDILGDILDPLIGPRFFNRYKCICCEHLDYLVYHEPIFYKNLKFLSAEGSIVLFYGVSVLVHLRYLSRLCMEQGWIVTAITDYADIPPSLKVDFLYSVAMLMRMTSRASVYMAMRPGRSIGLIDPGKPNGEKRSILSAHHTLSHLLR